MTSLLSPVILPSPLSIFLFIHNNHNRVCRQPFLTTHFLLFLPFLIPCLATITFTCSFSQVYPLHCFSLFCSPNVWRSSLWYNHPLLHNWNLVPSLWPQSLLLLASLLASWTISSVHLSFVIHLSTSHIHWKLWWWSALFCQGVFSVLPQVRALLQTFFSVSPTDFYISVIPSCSDPRQLCCWLWLPFPLP